MPQLDFTIFLPQIFWLIVIFGVFFAISSFIILPRLNSIKTSREDLINSNIKQAEQNNEKIKQIQSEINSINAQTNNQVMQIVADAEKKSQQNLQNAMKLVDEEFRKQLSSITQSIQQQGQETIKASDSMMQKITNDILQKLKS